MTALANSRRLRLGACLAVLVMAYLIQSATPLRLNTDAVRYLSVACPGEPTEDRQESVRFPPGYAWLVSVLARFDLASSPSLIALNLAATAAGLGVAYQLGRSVYGLTDVGALLAIDLTLLSWVLIKHTAFPQSDVVFMGVSLLALGAASAAEEAPEGARAGWWWIVAVALAVAAVGVRMAGVALIPAMVWPVLAGRSRTARAARSWTALAAATALVAALFWGGRYLSEARDIYAGAGWARRMGWNLIDRMVELGEVTLNLPVTFARSLRWSLLPAVGGVALFVLGRFFWARRAHLRSADVYLLSYALVIVGWPYYDPRLWLPVLPLLLVLAVAVGRRFSESAGGRWWMALHGGLFAALGLTALAYSTWLTFSGVHFPERYGKGRLQSTYETAFGLAPRSQDPVDADALRILGCFEPRAAKALRRP